MSGRVAGISSDPTLNQGFIHQMLDLKGDFALSTSFIADQHIGI